MQLGGFFFRNHLLCGQYRKYEEGEMPSVSNGKMISALKDPHFFLEILKLAQNQFPNDEILKIEKRVKELLLNNSCFENKINHLPARE